MTHQISITQNVALERNRFIQNNFQKSTFKDLSESLMSEIPSMRHAVFFIPNTVLMTSNNITDHTIAEINNDTVINYR